jgi:hypothetical protein
MNAEQLIRVCEDELADAVMAIQQPRSDFQLKHFVVGQHDTEPRRWFQCVLQLQLNLQHLRRANVQQRMTRRKISTLRESGNPDDLDEAELLLIDLDAHSLAVVGTIRETQALLAIYRSFPRSYSNAELNAAEEEYWQIRLLRQARHSLIATGRVAVGELDSLHQMGSPVTAEIVRNLENEICSNLSSPQNLAVSFSVGPSNHSNTSPAT